jgi:hypothetical protein
MPVETAADLAALFDPEDFAEAMVAHTSHGTVPFNGILTTAPISETDNIAQATMTVPRIVARRAAVPGLAQNDTIEVIASGKQLTVNDIMTKGEMLMIHCHDYW